MKKMIIICSFLLLLIYNELNCQNLGGWIRIDSLKETRTEHAGIILSNGDILIAGTNSSPNPSPSCEIYDIKTGKWNYTASMNIGRIYHKLIELNDHNIIAIGGFNKKTCEIYEVQAQKWSLTDSLDKSRFYGWTASSLNDGRVLVVAGRTDYPATPIARVLKDCEIYDPTLKIWIITDSLNTARFYHTMTKLVNGKILVAGGTTLQDGYLSSCEIYDPTTNKWSSVSPMNHVRANHSATLLPGGRVIVAGGRLNKVEIYNPEDDSWEIVGETTYIFGQNRAFTIGNGKYLLMVGGQDAPGWELFSLTDYRTVEYRQFEKIVFNQVFLKLDEEKLVLIGGREIILNGLPAYSGNGACYLFDLNVTGVKEFIDNKVNKSKYELTLYPNPFNNSSMLNVKSNAESHVSIKLFDLLGRDILSIFDGFLTVGNHSFVINPQSLSSGIYFIQYTSLYGNKTIKLVYQK
jgi:hypothetical protein